jgi:hypothetical protein
MNMTFDEYMDIFHEEAEKAEAKGLSDDEAIASMDLRYKELGLPEELSRKYSGMMLNSIANFV